MHMHHIFFLHEYMPISSLFAWFTTPLMGKNATWIHVQQRCLGRNPCGSNGTNNWMGNWSWKGIIFSRNNNRPHGIDLFSNKNPLHALCTQCVVSSEVSLLRKISIYLNVFWKVHLATIVWGRFILDLIDNHIMTLGQIFNVMHSKFVSFDHVPQHAI